MCIYADIMCKSVPGALSIKESERRCREMQVYTGREIWMRGGIHTREIECPGDLSLQAQ